MITIRIQLDSNRIKKENEIKQCFTKIVWISFLELFLQLFSSESSGLYIVYTDMLAEHGITDFEFIIQRMSI